MRPRAASACSPRTSASTRCGRRSTSTSPSPGAGSTPAASIGASIAQPDLDSVLITGDGSVQMNIQELATARQFDVPVKVVIMNNGYLGMVRQWQELFWDRRYSQVDMGQWPDFVKLAEAYGCTGVRLTDKTTLVDDLKAALAIEGPVVIDARVTKEESVYPMIAPGQAARDMVG